MEARLATIAVCKSCFISTFLPLFQLIFALSTYSFSLSSLYRGRKPLASRDECPREARLQHDLCQNGPKQR